MACERGDALTVLFTFEFVRLRDFMGDGFGEVLAIARGESCGDNNLLMSILEVEWVAHGVQL